MNLTPPPSYFRIEPMNEDHDQHAFAPNHQVTSPASTLSSASYRIFFNSTQDHAGYYRTNSFQPQCQDQDENQGDGLSYEIKNKVSNGLKLTLWKKEDQTDDVVPEKKNINPVMMRKNKKNDGVAPTAEKMRPSSSLETDISSNGCSYNSSSSPIRVCADCSTTKTPLWRSGPKGPKSLCNACGIRQRKARRAMAATAAAGSDQPPAVRIKVQQKEKIRKNNKHSSNDLKKRCKMGAGSPNNGQKKLSFEDFLINLDKKLSFHRVFPEDEKDAAILLMAISSGLVHG